MKPPRYLLTRQEEHRLATRLATLMYDREEIRTLLSMKIVRDEEGDRKLNLNPSLNEIPFTGSAIQDWKEVYQSIPDTEIAILLQYLVTTKTIFYQDPELEKILGLIRNRESHKINRLAESIKTGECILFLGPGVLRDTTGKLFNQLLANYLADKIKHNEVYYDPAQIDNLSYIAQRYDKVAQLKREKAIPNTGKVFRPEEYNDQGLLAEKYYTDNKGYWRHTTDLYKMIARFGFPVIINTNPDYESLLGAIKDIKAFDEDVPRQGTHAYYSLANGTINTDTEILGNEQEIQENRLAEWASPLKSGQKPKVLLYNLFGSFENPASVLVAERQLLDFTTRVVKGNPGLPRTLTDLFLEPKSYLFLGFDFDQWFVRLIFNTVLRLDRTTDRTISIFPDRDKRVFSETNREFFEEVFNMYFVAQELPLFLDRLAKACGIIL